MLSSLFISRPIATLLLTIGIAIAGLFAYTKLPVSPLPDVDFPTISVNASLPGASPDTVASSVASPLERYLGTIAGLSEMTSSSSVGACRIVLQFDLDRDINGAARDVQAAINAAHADLPTSLRSNPSYRQVNPAESPVLIIALTSPTMSRGQIYDAANQVLGQRLSQINGVGQVILGGAAMPAVRVDLNPLALSKYGIGLEDVRAALASANANSPKGAIEEGDQHYQLSTNDQSTKAADYVPLVIAYRKGAAVQLGDVADVTDGVENIRNAGLADGKPSILVIVFREPTANIITTVDAVKAELSQLKGSMPADIDMTIANDRTPTIRASLSDTERTLVIAVCLVTAVVFLFLRNVRATLIPVVAVPVSIIGTFGIMYLFGFSLDNLSLMALTIATGFVVDDAIVVMENIARHIEAGMAPKAAAYKGAAEVGFTVVSISLSLVAVFLPILLMGGIVGRLFREFALTLSVAIIVSLAVSLTTTPTLCALILRPRYPDEPGKQPRFFERLQSFYGRSLAWALGHSLLVVAVLAATMILNVALYVVIPKGFFPTEDTGQLTGQMQADQDSSFQAMQQKLTDMIDVVSKDPSVEHVVGFTGQGSGGGGGQGNTASVFIALKPLGKRPSMDQVMSDFKRNLAHIPGARLILQPVQDIRVGGRQSAAAYQYTLQGESDSELYTWAPKLLAALQKDKALEDVNSDQEVKGLETNLVVNRDAVARLGLTMSQVDNTLYDAFGQRQVSTIYEAQNQYHVVMEVAPPFWQSAEGLNSVYISTSGGGASGTQTTNAPAGTVVGKSSNSAGAGKPASGSGSAGATASAARNAANNSIANVGKGSASSGSAVTTAAETMVPLSFIAQYQQGYAPLAVNHQGDFVATTISFNLAPGKSLSDAVTAIDKASTQLHLPADIKGSFAGTAETYQQSLDSEPLLVAAALIAVYIVLGILYESLVHPITILSTLPSAGVGALLSLVLLGSEFNVIVLIGVILLIGIVKKNAIMMIDFALDAERNEGLAPRDAIYRACLLRFRPILMTTSAAMLGAMPLALSFGIGGELRRPLGISIVGGLAVSQVLTLYTTPVVYLYLDRFRHWVVTRWRGEIIDAGSPYPAPAE
jgi:multidrug efflux pump